MATPWAASRAAMSRVTVGLMVLMSMTSAPAARPSIAPPGPLMTASTSGLSVTMLMKMSQAAATAAGLAASVAPAATQSSMPGRLRFQTATS